MAGIELGLAALGAVDVCLRFGGVLLDKLAAYKAAETDVAEKILTIELHWRKTSMQLEFIRSVWDELDVDHQRLQEQILFVLVEKLRVAIAGIERVSKKFSDKQSKVSTDDFGKMQKFKYMFLKESLTSAVQDLSTWQSSFDPTWFLMMRIVSPVIDRELAAHKSFPRKTTVITTAAQVRNAIKDVPSQEAKLFLDDSELQTATIVDIPFSSTKRFQKKGSSSWYVLDIISCYDGAILRQMKSDIRDLASKLTSADPITFGLLKCKGVVVETDFDTRQTKSFDFLFSEPKDSHTPQSLRARLLESIVDHSLSSRLMIAKQLVRSASYIHTYGFVHKNIRPETVLVFADSQSTLVSAFLLGFEKFRLVAGNTLRRGDTAWENNLYRHPERQGTQPENYYVMQHDIYSLGVCLLEIGLWESLVQFDDGLKPVPSSKIQFKGVPVSPLTMKDKLVDVAKTFLPAKIGNMYTDLVVSCLTCLDTGNSDFGDESEFQDEDGVLVAIRYIEKIVLNLDKVSV